MIFILSYTVNSLERELLGNQNAAELTRLIKEFKRNPEYQLPQTAKLRFYLTNGGNAGLPEFLHDLPVGFNDELVHENAAYFVLISKFNDQVIYIINDISEFEATEQALNKIFIVSWIIFIVMMFAVSYLLSRYLLKPISDFADEIESLKPEQRGLKLSGKYSGLEIEKITRAFDKYLIKLDEHVERQHSFAAMASHELRTPLTIVQTSAELIGNQTDKPQIISQCQKIQRSTTKMNNMILALLSITRDQFSASDNEKVLLASSISEEVESCQNEIKLNNIEINNLVKTNITLNCNTSLLSVVINNLLSNAIKHCKNGLIQFQYDQNVLSIIDNGSGLDAADTKQLFKFGVAGKNSGGYGLGLYITHLICDKQGWKLDLINANPGTAANVAFLK